MAVWTGLSLLAAACFIDRLRVFVPVAAVLVVAAEPVLSGAAVLWAAPHLPALPFSASLPAKVAVGAAVLIAVAATMSFLSGLFSSGDKASATPSARPSGKPEIDSPDDASSVSSRTITDAGADTDSDLPPTLPLPLDGTQAEAAAGAGAGTSSAGGVSGTVPAVSSSAGASVGGGVGRGPDVDPALAATIPDWSLVGKELSLDRGTGKPGSWDEPDATQFKLRTRTYLSDRVKAPSQPQAFRLVGVNCFSSTKPIQCAAENLPQLREYLAQHQDKTSQWMVIVFNLPGKPVHNMVYVFARQLPHGADAPMDTVLDRFLSGDDKLRNSRLKLLAKLDKAPWVIGTAANRLGIERPAILGKKITVSHHVGPRFFEADVDVGSSKIASAIHGLILRACSSVVVTMAFCIEGQEEAELPERILGNVRHVEIPIQRYVVDVRSIL